MAKKKLKKERIKKKAEAEGKLLILRNKRIGHDYEILDRFEAGMCLMGSEVKSLRSGDCQWGDAHARVDDKLECFLYGFFIGEYRQAGTFGHLPSQRRKLLLNRKELKKLRDSMKIKGLTIIPSQVYFRKGWAKIEICLCKGRDRQDKRTALVNRERDRDIAREMARRIKR